jgi:hypothetical protein
MKSKLRKHNSKLNWSRKGVYQPLKLKIAASSQPLKLYQISSFIQIWQHIWNEVLRIKKCQEVTHALQRMEPNNNGGSVD